MKTLERATGEEHAVFDERVNTWMDSHDVLSHQTCAVKGELHVICFFYPEEEQPQGRRGVKKFPPAKK